MHRTDTLDMFTVAYGEIYLVTDTDETLHRPGDTAVVQGVNHAWANKSDKTCMIIGVNVHANPWPADRYPADGLLPAVSPCALAAQETVLTAGRRSGARAVLQATT
jgi:uncharacterized cupin superfamily protein